MSETDCMFATVEADKYRPAMRGIVRSLYRYPIKSLRGEAVSGGHFSDRGLAGDRAFAFIDDLTGKVASAKEPKRWSALLSASARYAAHHDLTNANTVAVTLPDGRTLRADDGALLPALRSLVGRAVRLVSAPPSGAVIERVTPEGEDDAGTTVDLPVAGGAPEGTLFDFAPVHLVSTASLRALEDNHPAHTPSQALRFRPNLVLELEDAVGFVESQWSDLTVRIGAARLRVICATPRCAVPTLAQGTDIAHDAALIRTLARHNRVPVPGFGNLSCLGAYASVIEPGEVRVGDVVQLET